MRWRRLLLNMEWQIDGGSGHVLWSLNKAGHINLQRIAGCRLVEDRPRRPQVRLGWLFLVWADIRADQMHIETAFRSHTATAMDSLASFSSLFIFCSILQPASWEDSLFLYTQYGSGCSLLPTFLLPSDDFLGLDLS